MNDALAEKDRALLPPSRIGAGGGRKGARAKHVGVDDAWDGWMMVDGWRHKEGEKSHDPPFSESF